MSKELSDTDSVNSEPDNSVYFVNNVYNENDTDKNCKGKSEHHTNHMHDIKNNSLKSMSYKTLGHQSTSKSTSQNSTNYVNTVMDNKTNINTIEQGHSHQITSNNQDTNTHYVNMVTENMINLELNELTPTDKTENYVLLNSQDQDQESHTLNALDSDLNFNELTHTGTENFVLINNQHFEEHPKLQKPSNSSAKYTNIAGKEAKPPKAPNFIFPLKDKVIPENLSIDKRSDIDKFRSILATLQQIYPLETYENICSTCQRDCAILDLDHKTNTSVCFQLYKKLIKHYRATN